MKKIVLILFTLGISSSISAQLVSLCGTEQKNVPYKGMYKELKPESRSVLRPDSPKEYVIPVVVHVLHTNGPEKIDREQVESAIEALNHDLNIRNSDLQYVIPEFRDIIGNTKATFKLAKLDPNGNPTEGIEWIEDEVTNNAWNGYAYVNQWPPRKYLNIWTVGPMKQAGGYAHYPSTADVYPNVDGIVVTHYLFGTKGTAAPYQNYSVEHVLAHEVGHYLNLIHPSGDSGDACLGTDYVDDTPQTSGKVNCNPPYDVCNPGIFENFQNIMTGNYGCFNMFTQGQVERMHNTLNSSVAGRNNLWHPNNLKETGVDSASSGVFENIKANTISIAPNPTTDLVFITGLKGKELIKVYDLSRQLLQEFENTSSEAVVSLGQYKKGTYMITITVDQGSKLFKVIRQ